MMPEPKMAMIRIPYVKVYTDRHGRVRRYFRKPGRKALPLPGVPGSAEFMDAYRAALGEPAPTSASRQHRPGSVGALICDYLKSPAFFNLKPSSQRIYRIALDRFGGLHGHRMVSDMPRDKVAAYIHAIGAEKPGMANITPLSCVGFWGMPSASATEMTTRSRKLTAIRAARTTLGPTPSVPPMSADGLLARESGLRMPCCSVPGNVAVTL
jgi:hypothetical protein